MRVQKLSRFLFLALFTICLNIPGITQHLEGTYTWSIRSDSSGRILVFKDGKFSDTYFNDLDSTKGEGSYVVNKNRLILSYHQMVDHNMSICEVVIKTVGNFQSINLDLMVVPYEIQSEAFIGAFIVLQKDSTAIATLFADNLGKAFVKVNDTSLINSVRIFSPGYNPVIIPIEKLTGKNIFAKCILRMPGSFIEEGTDEYIINENYRDRLTLTGRKSSYVFIKQKARKNSTKK